MRTAQVVPAIPTFAVDDGFAYAVPEGLGVSVGSIVRVPLGRRRVRGFVVGLRDDVPQGLKQVIAVAGDYPVFDSRLLETLRWAAIHYVAPLSVLLAKAAPPNLPRIPPPTPPFPAVAAPHGTDLDTELLADIAAGKRSQPVHLTDDRSETVARLAAAAASEDRTSLVIAPTVAEGEHIATELSHTLGPRVTVSWSQLPARRVTEAWGRCHAVTGTVLVATREAAWWPGHNLGVAVVAGEGRRAMKERQTPTTHVRDVLRRRGAVERFAVAGLGAVPTTETVAAGVQVISPPGRRWPLVEIVDRTEDPPGSGVVTGRARAAIRSVVRRGGRSFVLAHSRGATSRCVSCRALRQCSHCATSLGRHPDCLRCGRQNGPCSSCGGERFEPAASSIPAVVSELQAALGAEEIGKSVSVGTERDLPPTGSVDLAVCVDGDGLVFGANYRSAEEALRLLARLTRTVRHRRRCIVQTSRPDHHVFAALRRGHADEFLGSELAARQADGFPPAGELMAIDVTDPPSSVGADIQDAAAGSAIVLGPARSAERARWLIQGRDLRRLKVALRPHVQAWRDSQARVRIDADPVDL